MEITTPNNTVNICVGGAVTVTISNSEIDHNYRLRQSGSGTWFMEDGNGGLLSFNPITFNTIGTTTWTAEDLSGDGLPFETFNVNVHELPTAPTLTLSQAAEPVNAGPALKATAMVSGSGGYGTMVEALDYSIDDGDNWIPYDSGDEISSTQYNMPSVKIRAKRYDTQGRGCSAERIYTWTIISRVHDVTGTQGSYYSIQQAIDAATVAEGDLLEVEDGTYPENLQINKANLTLKADNQHDAIIQTQSGFNAGSGYGGITVLANSVTVEGFKIEQNVGQAIIHTNNSNSVTIKNNWIVGLANAPRGIDVGYSSANSDGVVIEGNIFEDLNCAVYINQATNLLIDDNDFQTMGEGVVVFDGTWNYNEIDLTNNTTTSTTNYLMYFYGSQGEVTYSGNTLASPTLLSNWKVYNVTKGIFYTTIQGAVTAADADNVLEVAAGTFNEEINLNKKITLKGVNAGIAAGANPGTRGPETIIVGGFYVTAAATIDGFQIKNGSSSGSIINCITAATSGITVLNSILQDVTGSQNNGLETTSGTNNLTLTNNTITNNWRGIYLNPGSGHTLTGNLIDANNGVGVGIGSDGQSNLSLTGNIISNHTLEGWGISAVGANVVAHQNRFYNYGISLAHYGGQTIDATCNWWGSAEYSEIFSDVSGKVTYVPFLPTDAIDPLATSCTGGPAVPTNLILTYDANSQNINVAFDVTANELELQPIPGVTDEAALLVLYQNLAVALAGSDEEAKLTAAFAVGDDVMTEYYYYTDESNLTTKTYLQTAGSNPLVKNKYYDNYLNRVSDGETFPNWVPGDLRTLVTIDRYTTSTNPATLGGTVATGWLNPVLGRKLYVTATFINNGYVNSVNGSVQIDKGPVNVYSADPSILTNWVSSHLTIQEAIDAAENGDFIVIDGGTYNEDASTASYSLGTKQGLKFIGEIDVNGDPTTIINGSLYLNDNDGGKVENIKFVYNTTLSLLSLLNTNGLEIKNCVFEGDNFTTVNIVGINHVSGPNGNSAILVEDCKFMDGLHVGIGSRFSSISAYGHVFGLHVKNSLFENVKSGINHQGGNDVIVENSTFNLNGNNSYGVRFASDAANNLTVTGSSFSVASAGTNVAIWLRANAGGTLLANGNSIGFGVLNESAYSFDATCNWWGTENAGDITALVSDNVQYLPFLVEEVGSTYPWSGTTAYSCDGNGPVLVYNADPGTTGTLVSSHMNIQDAIDAATTLENYFIKVSDGIYNESIEVDKNGLTLLGPNAGINPNTGPTVTEAIIKPLPADNFGILVTGAGFTLDGITVDGNNLPDEVGIEIYTETGAGGYILKNNVVKNIGGTFGIIGWTPNTTTNPASSNNLITENLVEGIPFPGRAITTYGNFYANITYNFVRNAGIGLSSEDARLASTGIVEWKNNTISTTRAGIWYHLQGELATSATIKDNIINVENNPAGTRWYGMWITFLGQRPGNINPTISGNIITGGTVNQTTSGYHLWNNLVTASAPDGIKIQGGSVSDVDYGIWVNNWEGSNTGGSNGKSAKVKVDGVTITNTAVAGIYLHDNPSNTLSVASVYAKITNSTISNSGTGILVEGNDASVDVIDNATTISDNQVGIFVKDGADLASVTGNTITNNTHGGIILEANAGTIGLINNNAISGNGNAVDATHGLGLQNGLATVVDATNNWWGDASGPYHATYNTCGAGNSVVGLVNISPWKDAVGGSPIALPIANVTNVPNTYYCTIQDAVDDATAGSVIKVLVASHTEGPQIVVDRNITLIGMDATSTSTTLLASGNTGNSGDARGWILVNEGITFNMSNLTLDGVGHLVYIGVLSHGPGTIDNCIIKNIGFNPSGPDYAGRGIAIYGYNMVISNNQLANIGRIGIFVYGTGVTNAQINNNTYTGKGTGNWLDYAVEFSGGRKGNIVNLDARNCLGVASVDNYHIGWCFSN